jgi:hypothetical protein
MKAEIITPRKLILLTGSYYFHSLSCISSNRQIGRFVYISISPASLNAKAISKLLVGLIIYLALGYWAVGETIYKNKILFSTQTGGIFIEKLVSALMLGWICIPVAIIKLIFFRR